jgi:hypothetical protein
MTDGCTSAAVVADPVITRVVGVVGVVGTLVVLVLLLLLRPHPCMALSETRTPEHVSPIAIDVYGTVLNELRRMINAQQE